MLQKYISLTFGFTVLSSVLTSINRFIIPLFGYPSKFTFYAIQRIREVKLKKTTYYAIDRLRKIAVVKIRLIFAYKGNRNNG